MPSDSRATTSHQSLKYQGYPYVNPPAFGVPTIDPYTASRWANLPRRPIGTAVRIEDQAGCSGYQNNHQIERDKETSSAENKQDIEDNPVVYIDLPDTTDNSLCENRNNSNQHNVKTPEETISYRSDDEPVLYIDLPGDGESDLYERTGDTAQNDQRLTETMARQTNKEDDEQPVVYIDIPECSGSGVSERRPTVEDGLSTSVVQETILYDQFKDRRIELPLHSRDSDDSPQSSNNSTMRIPYNPAWRRIEEERPTPPTSLNFWSPGASNIEASTSSGLRPTPSYLPSYTPEIQEYRGFRRTPEDDFRLPPLPVTEFPEPPPAYTEIDLGSSPSLGHPTLGSPVTTTGITGNLANPGPNPAIIEQPPRTTVILNGNTDLDRKYMTCQYCGMTVHSLVVRQTSLWTHIAAISCLIIGMVPCTICIYCCDCCKGKAHYCPNCNKLIKSESILNIF